MERYKKASVVALWLYFIISSSVTFHEYPSIHVGQDLYLGTKVLLQIWLLGICIWYPRNSFALWPNLMVGIHVIIANIHGQYFSPWYLFSFIEMILAYSFLFPVPRKPFNILLAVGTFAFIGVSLYRYEEVFKWIYTSQPADLISTTVSATVVAWLCHNFFTADRTYREELVRKFGIIGLQAATIVHDIKSMLSAPRLYLDLLKQKIPQGDSELVALVESLEKQMLNINRAVTGLNQVVALQDQSKEELSIKEVVAEVGDTLSLQSRSIELQIQGDLQLVTEKALIKSILFNLMMNSIHAFRRNKIVQPCIRVVCDDGAFVMSDNGGGFPEEILSSIADYRFDSFEGTGMGLFLVWNGVQTLGGSVYFTNCVEGAQIKISVPQRVQPQKRRSLGYYLRPS